MLLRHSGKGETPSAVPHVAFDTSPEEVVLENHANLNGSKTCCLSFTDNLDAFDGNSVEISSGAQGSILNFESPNTLSDGSTVSVLRQITS